MITNRDIVAEAASGNAEGGLKKLIDRVTALEERVTALEEQNQLTNADIKLVQLQDDTAGHNAGWDPALSHIDFFIIDEDVESNSVISISVIDPNTVPGETPCGVARSHPNVGFSGWCEGPDDGSILNYMIVTPTS